MQRITKTFAVRLVPHNDDLPVSSAAVVTDSISWARGIDHWDEHDDNFKPVQVIACYCYLGSQNVMTWFTI
jgi:hypothetical protein